MQTITKRIIAVEILVGIVASVVAICSQCATPNEEVVATEITTEQVGNIDYHVVDEVIESESVGMESQEESTVEGGVIDDLMPFVPVTCNGQWFVYQEVLYHELDQRGIAWWFPYAIAQCYQESRFNVNASCKHGNGFDCGLFQFYTKYWSHYSTNAGVGGADIYDPIAQIKTYCYLVSKRLSEGRTTEQTISDHYTGGQGYSDKYVNDVLQWTKTIE